MRVYRKDEVDTVFSGWKRDLEQLDELEVYTKDEVITMLTEIKGESSSIRPTIGNCASFAEGIRAYDKLIQQKINSLKEDTNQ